MTITLTVTDQLAEVRAEIHRTETYLDSRQYYSAPWEHQHNVNNTLNLLRARETRLAAELAADEARTADLTARAAATGAPQLAALLYIPFGDTILDTPKTTETPATQNPARMELRAATVADIVTRLTDSDYMWTAVTALGWGMGPAQLGIGQAVRDAEAQGLVIVERHRGNDRVRLAA